MVFASGWPRSLRNARVGFSAHPILSNRSAFSMIRSSLDLYTDEPGGRPRRRASAIAHYLPDVAVRHAFKLVADVG